MGFLNILTLIFVVAKIFGFITWSWFLVLLPTIISLTFALLFLLLAAFIGASK